MERLAEVIGVNEDNCINCHQCIAVCPVKICSDGSGKVVKFHHDRCIGCGRCIEACIKSHGYNIERSARYPIDDSLSFIQALGDSSQELIALVAPSARSHFNIGQLVSGLRELGVKAVYDVSLGAEIAVAAYGQLLSSGDICLPLIAQPCPAVVTYIELHHPCLIDHLAPVGSPVNNLARLLRDIHPLDRMVFISPCLAKRREFDRSGEVDFNIVFSSLQGILKERGIEIGTLPDGEFDYPVKARAAVAFSMPGGLKSAYLNLFPQTSPSSVVRLEGPDIYDRYLKELEQSIQKGWGDDMPRIIDILSCANGCNGGAGCLNDCRTIYELESIVARESEIRQQDAVLGLELDSFLGRVLQEKDFSYNRYKDISTSHQIIQPEQIQIEYIYSLMLKNEENDFRNCAACGYNSCHDMAVAIFNGLNQVENCYLYREKELKRDQEMLNRMVKDLANLNEELQNEVAERKNQEDMLVYNSKLAAMGEMIGMIAHQWRQPLSSISTLAGNLKVYMELDLFNKDEFDTLLEQINQHAQYLSNTINDFRNFFKPDNPRDMVRLDTVIENTLGIIGKSLEYKNIELIKEYNFDQELYTYPNELMQVFLNILKNAADAFVDKNIKNPIITIRGYNTEEFHSVEFIDNAGGISNQIIDRIFDPYFSTKGPGVGTGLGLYMSKMIVEEHCKGRLWTRNGETGAIFTVRLPVGGLSDDGCSRT